MHINMLWNILFWTCMSLYLSIIVYISFLSVNGTLKNILGSNEFQQLLLEYTNWLEYNIIKYKERRIDSIIYLGYRKLERALLPPKNARSFEK